MASTRTINGKALEYVAHQPLRWASWVAVSSAPQAAEDKISIPYQRQLNQEHCARHGGEIIAELLVPGESRHIPTWEEACQEVTAYALLRDLIVNRQIDVLVFYDRTRLGRMASLIMTIEALCLRAGIALYETTNPPAEIKADYQYERSLIGAIGAVGAQQEIEKFKERRRIGMANRIQRGEFPNKPNWGYYYKYDERGNRTVAIDEDAAQVVRLVFRLYLEGKSMRAISATLNEQGHRTPEGMQWRPTSINTIIAALPVYAGRAVVFRTSIHGTPKVEAPGNWDPILSGETVRSARIEQAQRADSRNITRRPYRFTGMCHCIDCGRPMACATTHIDTHNYKYVRCLRHDPYTAVRESVVLAALESLIESICRGDWSEFDAEESDANAEEARLTEIDRRRKQLALAYELADNAYINQRMNEERYAAQIAVLGKRKAALDAEYAEAMGNHVAAALAGTRAERLREIAQQGMGALSATDLATANAWLRRTFRVWCGHKQVVYIEVLF